MQPLRALLETHETFWTLFHDTAHWEFELFLIAIFDGLIGYVGFKIAWPRIRAHIHRDVSGEGADIAEEEADVRSISVRLDALDSRLRALEKKLE